MSLSQMLVYWIGCIYFGLALPSASTFWEWFRQCTVAFWACLGYYITLYFLFSSDWYKGVEKAVGFSLGF